MTLANEFEIFPAIDLLDGKSVRLKKGVRATAEVVHADPLRQLCEYRDAGARWVHVVNLNAAFGESPSEYAGAARTLEVLRSLIRESGIFIQLGGGIRSEESLQRALDSGAHRVVIGTWATTHFDEVMSKVLLDPERYVIGVDSFGGKIAVQGWTQTSGETTLDFAKRLKCFGVRRVLFTEVERDGLLQGAALDATSQLAAASGVEVIASGGVRDLTDVRSLSQIPGVSGVVTGRALAQGTLNLRDALMFSRRFQ
jgi:phosphoribosylformimino-5-aminoimidazole carboxamide ribotide isomerase